MSETFTTQLTQIEALQQGRHELAEQAAAREMHRLIIGATSLHSPINIENNGFEHDSATIDARDMFSAEAVGLQPQDLLKATGSDDFKNHSPILSLRVGSDTLTYFRLNDGLSVALQSDDKHQTPAKAMLSKVIQERLEYKVAQSSAHRAMHTVLETIGDTVPDTIASPSFDPHQDPLGTALVLSNLGIIGQTADMVALMRKGMSASQSLDISVGHQSRRNVQYEETDHSTIVQSGRNALCRLKIDKKTKEYQLIFAQRPALQYAERANQRHAVGEVPFVETKCAEELANLIDSADLMFHPQLQQEMLQPGSADRYGGVYTQITRELAKWVNRSEKLKLSNLFVPKNEHFDPLLQLEVYGLGKDSDQVSREYSRYMDGEGINSATLESQSREKFDFLKDFSAESEAAQVVLTIIRDTLGRVSGEQQSTDLSVTEQDIEMRDGSCFDVSAYYLRRAGSVSNSTKIVENGTEMYQEPASDTYLTINPIIFNGVSLPKGAQFKRESDGWAFMRLTHFSFDEAEDHLAFGTEVSKAKEVESGVVRSLGGLTLDHVLRRVS